jgi:hypothetical protein
LSRQIGCASLVTSEAVVSKVFCAVKVIEEKVVASVSLCNAALRSQRSLWMVVRLRSWFFDKDRVPHSVAEVATLQYIQARLVVCWQCMSPGPPATVQTNPYCKHACTVHPVMSSTQLYTKMPFWLLAAAAAGHAARPLEDTKTLQYCQYSAPSAIGNPTAIVSQCSSNRRDLWQPSAAVIHTGTVMPCALHKSIQIPLCGIPPETSQLNDRCGGVRVTCDIQTSSVGATLVQPLWIVPGSPPQLD